MFLPVGADGYCRTVTPDKWNLHKVQVVIDAHTSYLFSSAFYHFYDLEQNGGGIVLGLCL